MRVKLLLPNREVFERRSRSSTKARARKARDEIYDVYNARAIELLVGEQEALLPPKAARLTVSELAAKCRDEWRPARGRSIDVPEQYYPLSPSAAREL
ncbi:MAG TPA: hypothetical protein VG944_13500 [Fimbriimonas sp.]|nr:hypothetical protein [Fimbriimonas sp.]